MWSMSSLSFLRDFYFFLFYLKKFKYLLKPLYRPGSVLCARLTEVNQADKTCPYRADILVGRQVVNK